MRRVELSKRLSSSLAEHEEWLGEGQRAQNVSARLVVAPRIPA
jgi:hypothetical protein